MKLPYGQSNFKTVAEDCYYVDRTTYIEHLEGQDNPYQFYLRPRKFGKSLFVSMLEHYYGQQHKADFERNFGRFYIGQQPTPLANRYLVLKFDFSGIQTSDVNDLEQQFADNVRYIREVIHLHCKRGNTFFEKQKENHVQKQSPMAADCLLARH